jgi:hypothetical protein
MERDPLSTNRSTHAALHDADRPTSARATRGRPYPAIAAVVALVLMSALVFSTLAARFHPGPGQGRGATLSGTPTVSPIATTSTAASTPTPTPSPVPLPAGMSVVSIAMVSATDGWAIAAPTASSAALVHYTGGHWMLLGDSYTGVYLNDLSMDAHDDGWAVGGHSDQVSGGVVLHYSGGRWEPVPTPAFSFAGQRVWAFSPSNAIVLAALHKGPTGAAQSALLRYDRGAWSETASPRGISDMSVLTADDIWATCLDGHVLHEQGGRWTTYSIGGQTSGEGGQPLSITMLSDSDGWAAGLTNITPQGMFLAHFDGAAWTRVQGPAASGPTEIHSIAMVSPTEGWAGGDLGNATGVAAVLLHYVNGQWQTTLAPSPDIGGIARIVMLSASEGWAAAEGGAAAGPLHYQNGRWTPYQMPPS